MRNLIVFIIFVIGIIIVGSRMDLDTPPQLAISSSYANPPLQGTNNSAAYMVLRNNGDTPVTIVGAESTVSELTEVHSHINSGGVMQMVRLPTLTIPERTKVTFRPGSYHIMLLGLTRELKTGETFGLKLMLEDGTELVEEVRILPRKRQRR